MINSAADFVLHPEPTLWVAELDDLFGTAPLEHQRLHQPDCRILAILTCLRGA